MTFVAWANLYICANVLLAAAVLMLRLLDTLSGKLRRPVAYGHRLAFGHTLLVAVLLLPAGTLVVPAGTGLPRTAQVWSAPTMNGSASSALEDSAAISVAPASASMPLTAVSLVAVGFLLIGVLVSIIRVSRDIAATRRIVSHAQTIRRHGRLRIQSSDEVQVPFSFWWPGRYLIVVPSALVLHAEDLRMAILHEGQHHRQRHTKWLYLYQLLKGLFFWNPSAHVLVRHLRALQEFACDEALSTRRSIVDSYCGSLLRVAEAAAFRRIAAVHAGMLGGGNLFLKRRVEAVLLRPASHQRTPTVVAAMAVAWSLLAATALSSGAVIHDRRVSAEDAARMAAARAAEALPIEVNEAVVRQLNMLLATPDGRAYLDASLARMRSHEKVISSALASHGLPAELLAVPLVESGYRNLPPDGPEHGAGLWMFIEPTARRFGLAIDAGRDDRLDVAAETRAAMEYFAILHRHFGDWGLAILAYNTGIATVEQGIRATGSHDVWQVIAAGYENDSDYLARVMAAMLILQNPSVVN